MTTLKKNNKLAESFWRKKKKKKKDFAIPAVAAQFTPFLFYVSLPGLGPSFRDKSHGAGGYEQGAGGRARAGAGVKYIKTKRRHRPRGSLMQETSSQRFFFEVYFCICISLFLQFCWLRLQACVINTPVIARRRPLMPCAGPRQKPLVFGVACSIQQSKAAVPLPFSAVSRSRTQHRLPSLGHIDRVLAPGAPLPRLSELFSAPPCLTKSGDKLCSVFVAQDLNEKKRKNKKKALGSAWLVTANKPFFFFFFSFLLSPNERFLLG